MCLVGRATSRLVTGLHSDLDDFYIKIDRFDENVSIEGRLWGLISQTVL